MLSRCAFMLAMMPALAPCAAASVELPSQIAVLSRAQPLNINGLQSDNYVLQSPLSPAELGPAIAHWWQREGGYLPVMRRQVGEWQVLSRRSAALVLAVQWKARAGGGSSGYLSLIDLARPLASQPSLPFKLPTAVRIRSYVQTQDAGNTATQFLAESSAQPAVLLGQMLRSASRGRWLNHSANELALRTALAAGRGACLDLQRESTQLEIVIDRDARGSSLVINQVERSSR
jgi:hypothetical protein